MSSRKLRVAAVGHVEWVEFAEVEHVPESGEVVHAGHTFCEPAGGGAVAAVQLARLAGGAEFFTALGTDETGRRSVRRLEELGVRVHVAWRSVPTRRALTLIDPRGERTIITLGDRLAPSAEDDLPWDDLARADAVYFTAGDAGALRAARAARLLVASPRSRSALDARVPLDALVLSARDPDERREAERRSGDARLLVLTEGARGGQYQARAGGGGRWVAAPVPGPRVDAYGCGDSFAAGLTFALGRGDAVEDALALAASCGACCLTGHGPYERQLTL